jgi:hypothetical protein
MPTFAPLHLRLRRALDLSSLLVLGAFAPACDTTPDQNPTITKAEVAKPEPAKPEPAKPEPETTTEPFIAKPEPPEPEPPEPEPPKPEPEVNRLPRCPTIDWCGSKPLVESMRPKRPTSMPDVEGCPSQVERIGELDPKLLAGQTPPPARASSVARIDATATAAKRAVGEADTCCYEWATRCPGGRPLLVDGRPWLAALRPGHGWTAPLPASFTTPAPALPEHVRLRLAEAWLRDALAEHASIASFARARAELLGIAAPAELVQACERAAADEVEHARLCFALAERFGGPAVEPTALPDLGPRSSSPLTVALDTFVEGCVGETIAAACARQAASLATDPVARAVLERIADDETEHAALAWRTIAWIIQREGALVLTAILARADALRAPHAPAPAADPDAAVLLACGRLDDRTLALTQALAWRELIDPLLATLRETTMRTTPRDPHRSIRRGSTLVRA